MNNTWTYLHQTWILCLVSWQHSERAHEDARHYPGRDCTNVLTHEILSIDCWPTCCN